MSWLTKVLWLALAAALIGLSACGGGNAPTPTIDPSMFYTQAAQTVEVRQAQTESAVPPTPEVTDTPEASPTPEETNTPLLSPTPGSGTAPATTVVPGGATAVPGGATAVVPTAAATRPLAQQATCDNFTFTDKNFPDGSQVPGGSTFVKTWTFKNLGPCSWNKNYRLIYGWETPGSGWEGVGPVYLSQVVNPGDSVDISVTLKAPTKATGYAAWFRLQNDKGYNFGPVFAVSIIVK